MPRVTVSDDIAAPLDKVFALFTDLDHSTDKVSGIKQVEMLTPGRFGLGTRWRETREVLGRYDTADMEVTSFEVNRTYTITHHKFGLGTRWRETREVLGLYDSAEMEVTSFEVNRTYTITHRKFGTRIDAVFSFEPTSRGTKVTIDFDLESPGMPPGILAPLGWAIAGKIREVLGHDLADLKKSAEDGRT